LFLSCPSVVTQFVSATPLKLQNRISWNLVDSKDTICSCAYYQEILIAWDHLAMRFQRRFLEIDQSETRITCGGHVC
jgi:hypothetical protein